MAISKLAYNGFRTTHNSVFFILFCTFIEILSCYSIKLKVWDVMIIIVPCIPVGRYPLNRLSLSRLKWNHEGCMSKKEQMRTFVRSLKSIYLDTRRSNRRGKIMFIL